MNCPTCSHLLDRVGHVALWCARCGTLLTLDNDLTHTPQLVNGCRTFSGTLVDRYSIADAMEVLRHQWRVLGIAEAIGPPDQRKESR